MQHIPDKEFDQLFRDKFSDAEIEPTANLWANIENQIQPKRKRSIAVYWMAAASVAVAITAMLVFQKTEKIQLQGTDVVANIAAPNIEREVTQDLTTPLPAKRLVTNENKVASKKIALLNPTENNTVKSNLQNIEYPMQPITANNRLPIKQQEVKPLAIVPIEQLSNENEIVYAQVQPDQDLNDNIINEGAMEKKGIRNVGDLVNFVVDKVDRRDKKLIKFSTDDDDNSSIVGINIGFLKLNKKNK